MVLFEVTESQPSASLMMKRAPLPGPTVKFGLTLRHSSSELPNMKAIMKSVRLVTSTRLRSAA